MLAWALLVGCGPTLVVADTSGSGTEWFTATTGAATFEPVAGPGEPVVAVITGSTLGYCEQFLFDAGDLELCFATDAVSSASMRVVREGSEPTEFQLVADGELGGTIGPCAARFEDCLHVDVEVEGEDLRLALIERDLGVGVLEFAPLLPGPILITGFEEP